MADLRSAGLADWLCGSCCVVLVERQLGGGLALHNAGWPIAPLLTCARRPTQAAPALSVAVVRLAGGAGLSPYLLEQLPLALVGGLLRNPMPWRLKNSPSILLRNLLQQLGSEAAVVVDEQVSRFTKHGRSLFQGALQSCGGGQRGQRRR